ncbi:PEP-CTERM sorting domain-containing protein [Massilia sp. BJB1822]|uniref:PEP-CTERM sorting domain-containing protein n=1 Tax=Massilia sp. BJB1822 TaxID=2744470 RepID=UPI001C3D5091|nr:PEP-CTERM sorting domain-containing protein [Massilia sp. BJB1822]
MKSSTCLPAALLGISLLLAGAGAQAASDVLTAGSSNLRFGVLDLTPSDGHAAGFSVNTVRTELAMDFSPRDWSIPGVSERYSVDGGPHVLARNLQDAYADITIGAAPGNTEIRYRSETPYPLDVYVTASYQQSIALTLKAHSLLTVNGTAHQSFANPSYAPERTIPYSQFSATLGGAGPGSSQSKFYMLLDKPWQEFARAQDFQLVYANSSDRDITVNLNLAGSIFANPVPEPSTYAMLGAGLALLGLTARRRQRRHAA